MCRSGRKLPQALKVFKWMKNRGIERPIYTFNALMVACGRVRLPLLSLFQLHALNSSLRVIHKENLLQCAAGDVAVELFEEMVTLGLAPDRITFTGLISATTAAGKWELAQSFIDKMQARGFSIGVNEYTEMQWACARARKPREAYGLFQVMQEQGFELTLENYNALLCAYERSAQWEDAIRTFVWIRDKGLTPDVISWSSLISACANAGQPERALEVLEKMKASNVTPNVVSWCGLLKAYQKTGDWEKARRLFTPCSTPGALPTRSAPLETSLSSFPCFQVVRSDGVFVQSRWPGAH